MLVLWAILIEKAEGVDVYILEYRAKTRYTKYNHMGEWTRMHVVRNVHEISKIWVHSYMTKLKTDWAHLSNNCNQVQIILDPQLYYRCSIYE